MLCDLPLEHAKCVLLVSQKHIFYLCSSGSLGKFVVQVVERPAFCESTLLVFRGVSRSILDLDAGDWSEDIQRLTIEQPTINTDARPEVASPTITSG